MSASESTKFYGKYRGVVTSTEDREQRGRVVVRVPDVYGEHESGWAEACLPIAAAGLGVVSVPPVGAQVWVEFEHGDPEYPIWVGCRVTSKSQLPDAARKSPDQKIVIGHKAGHSLVLDDQGLVVTIQGGVKLTLTKDSIELSNGQGASIKLSGPTVDVNNKALEVT